MPGYTRPIHRAYDDNKGKMKGVTNDKLTTPDIEGPFYQPNAPIINTGTLVDDPAFYLHGTVKDENGFALPNVVLDVWCADEIGNYDFGTTFRNRGKFPVDRDGNYRIGLPIPGDYKISETKSRCPHIHIKVWTQDECVLTTQIYFKGNELNKDDNWFSDKREVTLPDGTFNFVVAKPE